MMMSVVMRVIMMVMVVMEMRSIITRSITPIERIIPS
jgi:hypothetical protein